MSEHGRLSTIVEEVIATSQGTSFYVQTEPFGEGAGTFLTQDGGKEGGRDGVGGGGKEGGLEWEEGGREEEGRRVKMEGRERGKERKKEGGRERVGGGGRKRCCNTSVMIYFIVVYCEHNDVPCTQRVRGPL